MPFWSQILLLGCVGACVGGQLNRAIYRWAIFHKRSISPWSAPPENAPPRHWQDRIPLVGWCGLRREVSLHGPGFWVRPLLIELFVAVGFPLQYWWEMSGGLIPPGFPQPSTSVLMASCAVHVLLFCLMFIGSFIDLDEKTIPDEVTVLGALAGLILAALLPHAMLPNPLHGPPAIIRPLWLADPWPAWLHTSWGLAIGWSCFLGWLYAIVPKIWRTRGGLIKALRILVASLRRYAVNWTTGIGLVVGCVSIAGIWWVGGLHWRALLTSLVGLAFGGGMIWAVRIIGTVALRREAMGFGDVTLMAMVGAFVGWQPSVIIFFIAPLCGVFLAVGQWVTTGRKDIPYGPFLCFATWLVIDGWTELWYRGVMDVFRVLGPVVPWLLLFCLLLMHGMLTFWRLMTGPR